jgi:hypothetical protein
MNQRIEDKFYFGLSVAAKVELVKRLAQENGIRPDEITESGGGRYVNFIYKGENKSAAIQSAVSTLKRVMWPYGAHGPDIAIMNGVDSVGNRIASVYVSTRRLTKNPKERLYSP